MRKSMLLGLCGALALGALALPEAAPAQVRGGLRDRVGSHEVERPRVRGRDWDDRGHEFRERSHFRGSFGIFVGPDWDPWFWGPWYYPRPYYYPYTYRYSYPYDYPPPVVEPGPSTGDQIPEAAPEPMYWYRCENPAGYYPYVKQCPGGWTKVLASPEGAEPQAAAPAQPPAQAPPPQATPQLRQPADPGPPDELPEEYRWYHCADPEGYYPYVRECPGGWTPVAPAPAPAR